MQSPRFPNSEYVTDDVLHEFSPDNTQEQEKQKRLEDVTELVYEANAEKKRLTGRTSDRLYEETSIPPEIMFPADAKILYVGDPWQRLGIEFDKSHGSSFTLIDYEFGEVAAFVTDDEAFRQEIQHKGESLVAHTETMLTDAKYYGLEEAEVLWFKEFNSLVGTANKLSTDAQLQEDYYNASKAWGAAKTFLEETHKRQITEVEQVEDETEDSGKYDVISDFSSSAWYDCADGERGFRDLPDWNRLIVPQREQLKKDLKGLPPATVERELANMTRGWIEEIRLHKRTENANVVEAVFPRLPFKDDSFDRLVASWSISTHVFPELDSAGFDVFWDETYRVLSNGGEAYIFPLNYYYIVDKTLIGSLERLKEKHKDVHYELLDNQAVPVELEAGAECGTGYEYTLVIYKGDKVTTINQKISLRSQPFTK